MEVFEHAESNYGLYNVIKPIIQWVSAKNQPKICQVGWVILQIDIDIEVYTSLTNLIDLPTHSNHQTDILQRLLLWFC